MTGSISERMTGLDALVTDAARRWPDKPGLVFDQQSERLTFADIHQRSTAIAAGLADVGVRAGDRVAVMLPNEPAFPLTWLALAKLRAVLVPLHTQLREFDAGYLVAHSGSVVGVTNADLLPMVDRLGLPTVVTADQLNGTRPPEASALPEDLVNLQYTSGTTGRPKGCMLSHGYWTLMARNLAEYVPLGPDDIVLTAQPFSYMDPQWNLAATLASGATLVVLDRFHPSTFWSKIREHRVTFFYCLGVMPTLLLKMPPSPGDRDHRVRFATCSAIPPNLHAALEERFGIPWCELFGMTETGGDLAVSLDEHDELVGTGAIGRPFPHREARIVGDDDRPLPRGETGELVLRGAGMMDGYYNDPEATAAAFRSGWLHTGDFARQDEAGRIFYVGRKKEMIRRSGENISATEVEEAITLHPAVQTAACVPVPDEIRGEEVKAYVVLAPGEAVRPEDLAADVGQRIARFKVPRYWEFRDRLPLTPSEKIAKAALRDEKSDLRAGSYDAVEGAWS